MTNREKILETARLELGTAESPPNSNKSKYGAWYSSVLNGQKWCAMFVSWVYDHAGFPLGNIQHPRGIHHCQSAYNYYKGKGLVVKSPKPGDIVLFDWSGDGHADHIGIFKGWLDASMITFESYEGNTSIGNDSDGGRVMLRRRSKSQVKAFVNTGLLDAAIPAVQVEGVKLNDRGSDAVKVQKYLYTLGYDIVIDGFFGQKSVTAVKDFQKKFDMTETGVVDEITMGALQEEAARIEIAKSKFSSGSYLKKGDSGFMVSELQTALIKDNNKVDLTVTGFFGDKTTRAVKNFQSKNKLTADGVAGPITLQKLGLI